LEKAMKKETGVTIRFSSELLKKAKAVAKKDRRSFNSYINVLIEQDMERRKEKK
jgi:predicted DNA binding CopG/RHH family protein